MREEFIPRPEQSMPFRLDVTALPGQPLNQADSVPPVTAQTARNSDEPSPGVWGGEVFGEPPVPPVADSGGDGPSPPTDKPVPTPGEEPGEPHGLTAFDRQVGELENLISDALTKARNLNRQTETVVSDPGQAAALRDRLTIITESLGGVATNVVETRRISRLVESQEISGDDLELLSRFNGDIRVLGNEKDSYFNRGLNALWQHEIDTTGKALLAGAVNLDDIRDVGPRTIRLLKHALADHIPEIPLSEHADPALAARLYTSLRDVPLAVLDPVSPLLSKLRAAGYSGLSVKDILNPSIIEGYLSETGELEALSAFALPKLRVMAQQYADAFNAAKQSQA